MMILRAITLSTILLLAAAGPTLAQGMVDVLRLQQEQLEEAIQELEQSASADDELQKLQLQELKWKHQQNEEMISALGGDPVVEAAASKSVIKIEAAGVEYNGWPEMAVLVNGEQIALKNMNNKIRQMFTFDVPASVGAISTIEVKMTSEATDCKAATWIDSRLGATIKCSDRAIAVRGLYLNDEKIEGALAIGEMNKPWSVQSPEGGIKWEING